MTFDMTLLTAGDLRGFQLFGNPGGLTFVAASLGLGVAVGLFYFGGLWWTVRRIPASRRPGLLVLGSFWVRTGVGAAALIPLAKAGWPPLVAALAGILSVRIAAVRLCAPRPRPDERRAA